MSIAEKTLAHCGMYSGNEPTFLYVEQTNHFFPAYDFFERQRNVENWLERVVIRFYIIERYSALGLLRGMKNFFWHN
ncbi:MAG: hypothetical protein Q3X05_09690, partial [Bilophila sp.]|nr:hypothetical protein [Bilophila sp.]